MEDATYVQALERANLLSFYIENYLSGYHAQASVVAFGRGKENLDFLKKMTMRLMAVPFLPQNWM